MNPPFCQRGFPLLTAKVRAFTIKMKMNANEQTERVMA